MNGRQSLPEIVVRLIPRLASTFDGEVVATARAVEKALRRAGLDWHDLAKAVAMPPPLLRPPCRNESCESAEMRAWLEAVSREPWPNDWTQKFITSVLSRNSLDRLSEKQKACAESIIDEAYRRGVRP